MNKRTWLLGSASLLAAALMGCATSPAPKTIADTAASAPQLSTLNKLIQDAGMGDQLRGTGPYTVFAPSDEAFKALPKSTFDSLAGNKEQLKAVLSYHVLSGKMTAGELKTGNAKTLEGANVALSKSGTYLTVEDAVVTQADLPATNGVVHVIDRVLMPPKK